MSMTPNGQAQSDPAFPMPRFQSSAWRSYWSHRKDEGDSLINCPDLLSAAEELLEIPGFCSSSSAKVPKELCDRNGDICSYRHLQKLQNRGWADTIVKSLPDSIDECSNDQVMQKLDHALLVDPECIAALKMRAVLLIRTNHMLRARQDADKLAVVVHAARPADAALLDFVDSLYEQLDAHDRLSRREKSSHMHSRRRHSRSPRTDRPSNHSHSRSRSRPRRHRGDRDRRHHHRHHHHRHQRASGHRRDSDGYRRERHRQP
ncbi:hypothetical protein DL89DRAFT_264462 [Linderina pennispora]|uniref:Uncharacterized protein n=1 Tax=Linderina pennispora TaxID=61395 RepID=A0A1Y1WMQ1_9FUNG|nr:uncharacterized protein DL89DRAFT_264462 [Linderina pennispora]ORX74645.1 hypothetical protein DL89DRAFT_264462 [Linderina pennispora]